MFIQAPVVTPRRSRYFVITAGLGAILCNLQCPACFSRRICLGEGPLASIVGGVKLPRLFEQLVVVRKLYQDLAQQ